MEFILVLALIALCALAWGLWKSKQRLLRYSSIEDVEAYRRQVDQENKQVTRQLEQIRASSTDAAARLDSLKAELKIAGETVSVQRRADQLRQEAHGWEARVHALRRELDSVEEAIGLQSFGFYRPRYELESSGEYVERLKTVRDRQQQAVKSDRATHCPTGWTVDGSAAAGLKMVKEHAKLMLRAFNGECDAAVAKVTYSNVANLETRIRKSCETINKLGKEKNIFIVDAYLDLKIAELHLVHEHREKVQAEKEEQRRIKEQMREEQKAQKELEKAEADAKKDEDVALKALDKARHEMEAAVGAQADRMQALVAKLEAQLASALDRKAKAIARAQLTKSGHVYVISNIGSFGDGVYKIGMTRRLEPLERVDELGDASVPFKFDVHAMIYAENAPALENALHGEFAARSVNKVNMRREFFRVSLEEIRSAVGRHHGIVTFVTVPEAEEYRKTLSIEAERQAA